MLKSFLVSKLLAYSSRPCVGPPGPPILGGEQLPLVASWQQISAVHAYSCHHQASCEGGQVMPP